MVKYLGSKRALLEQIVGAVKALSGVESVLDLFSGTARVGHALKKEGYRVTCNDHNAFAHTLATAYVQADRNLWAEQAEGLIRELNEVQPHPGWFTQTFCHQSRFFRPENGAKIEAIREEIALRGLDPELEAIALASLMEAADRVDSTTGVQMAYLKQWAQRAYRPLELRLPDFLPGPGLALRGEALEVARHFQGDLAYLDPPYNQHSYLGNYHIWETLVKWDKPEVYGVACKRTECRARQSAFNSRVRFADAFAEVVNSLRVNYLVVSFSDEGFLSRPEIEDILSHRGKLRVYEHDYPRYVGARIGIHNHRGEKVGSVGRLRNTELLFVVEVDR